MIRLATSDDRRAIFLLCREVHTLSPYAGIESDDEHVHKVITYLVKQKTVWVTDNVDGVLMVGISPAWFNLSKLMSNDLVFYTKNGGGAGLLRAFVKWAKENVSLVGISVSSGKKIQRTEKLYKLMGFDQMGGTYLLRR